MEKLCFYYGVMGSSKTANALMTKFNYEQKGRRVWLIKPCTDTRDGFGMVKSRVGLSSPCQMIGPKTNLYTAFSENRRDVVDVHRLITGRSASFLTIFVGKTKLIGFIV